MKNKYISTISLALCATVLSLSSLSIRAAGTEGPGFELYNKDKDVIVVDIYIGGRPAQTTSGSSVGRAILPGDKLAINMNVKGAARISIYTKNSKTPTAEYMVCAKCSKNETMYLSWTTAKGLYRQTGTLFGLSGKSDSGYSLSNNVAAKDIVKEKPGSAW